MTATGTPTATVALWRDWRGWPKTLTDLWRRSLRFRTLSVTILATLLAVLVTCVVMALAIQNDLFESRRNQALEDARRATAVAQSVLDSADVGDDRASFQAVWRGMQEDIGRISASDRIAAFPPTGGVSGLAAPNAFSSRLSSDLLSDELRLRVRTHADRQTWQSVALTGDDGQAVPGIVVGQQLIVPEVGSYELYIAYDLIEADQTLLFVQRTLWFAGSVLVLIITSISWVVLRTVSVPVIEASETSARLASGDLGVRLPVHGEDELATLGRSFNAMADSIESQIKELGELSLVQQRFVSDVSHELRTPLTTIRLASDMINDHREEFDPVTGRAAELLHTQVQRFETLLNDLLEISRYDAGSVQLELEPTSLAHVAEEVIEQLQPLAATHGTALRLVAPGGYSPVDMDPRRVRRVLRNLIGNAIEHGEGRPIVVTVDSDQHAVAAGVRDFGLGMRADDVERVFDRFWRADPSRQRTIGGTGLGLSIARGDAELHGGTLAVWSEFGMGTNFVLTLPRGADRTMLSSPVPLEPPQPTDDLGAATEPIALAQLPAELFDDPGEVTS